MLIYRLTKERYSYGLSIYGTSLSTTNRWNRNSTEMIYTATSRARAMVEIMPHLALDLIPADFVMKILRIPDATENLDINTATAGLEETQSLEEVLFEKKKTC